ncbi:ester cyclase [Chryseolinea lacunae]|uniref:Ester cyclase n=1 Tax=Chryseolinea lacunae TaxID=2801331 RepID=A0ABS1KZA8_9BACT|nr:ester cyclase [Chryseolinea lacunae]MBL0744794.1 ester cyclase [Chryseolinea lacunae]
MNTSVQNQEHVDVLAKKGTCIEFFSAYQDMDVERMLSLCDANGTIAFVPLGSDYAGKIDSVGKAVWSALMTAFPNLDNTVKSQRYDEASDAVVCQVVIFGKQESEFAGMPSKGNDFDTEHIFIFRFNKAGKIADINVNWDHQSFVAQLTK